MVPADGSVDEKGKALYNIVLFFFFFFQLRGWLTVLDNTVNSEDNQAKIVNTKY